MAGRFTAYEKGLEAKDQPRTDRESAVSKSGQRTAETPAPQTSVQLDRRKLTISLANKAIIQLIPPAPDFLDAERKTALVRQVFELVGYIFLNTQPGIRLAAELSQFKYIKFIGVQFGDEFPANRNESDGKTLGNFDPAGPSSKYEINLLYQYGSELVLSEEERERGVILLPSSGSRRDEAQRWPGFGCGLDITYTHKRPASLMTTTFFHELLHVWFVNAYAQVLPGATGHGDVRRCQFDLVGDEPVFFNRLAEFYREIDKHEAGRAP